MTTQQTWAGMLATPLDVDDVVLGEMIWAGSKSTVSAGAILVVASALGNRRSDSGDLRVAGRPADRHLLLGDGARRHRALQDLRFLHVLHHAPGDRR